MLKFMVIALVLVLFSVSLSAQEYTGKIIQVYELGNNILRKVSKPVSDTTTNEIKEIIADMKVTLTDSVGYGLSAPQIGHALRIIIISPRRTEMFPNEKETGQIVMINPVIVSKSKETTCMWEGCLSIPFIRGCVSRFTSITVSYVNENNETVESVFDGLASIVCQHEIDHLDGSLFLDKVASTKDIITEREYKKKQKDKPCKEPIM